jgi:hypothetical protein
MCGVALVSLLIFCLDDLSIGDSGVMQVSHYYGIGSICALRAIRVFFLNVDGYPCVWCIYVKDWYFLLMNCSFN